MSDPENHEPPDHLTVMLDTTIVDIEPLVVDIAVPVTTERSVWVIRPDEFTRLPRTETPRPDADRDQGTASGDGDWVPIRAPWWCGHGGSLRVRVVPADRPAEARGIISSPVVEWAGR